MRLSLANVPTSVVKWRNRQRYWNKKEWKILRKDRGPQLPVPESIRDLPLWRKDGQDVGNWRGVASGPSNVWVLCLTFENGWINGSRLQQPIATDEIGAVWAPYESAYSSQ